MPPSADFASDSITLNEPPAPKRWAWLLLGLLVAAGLGLFWLSRSRGPALSGTPDTWTEAAQKSAVAAYLNSHVRLPGYKAEAVQVQKSENYWSLARKHGISIDTIVGLNPDMRHMNAYVGRWVLVANTRGAMHQVQAGQTAESIEKEYGLEPGAVKTANRLGWFGRLNPGQLLILPGVRPRPLNPDMQAIYDRRNQLRSPLAGKYTSLVGTRTDPFTGSVRHHNGVDIKAPFNSLVAASAAGTVSLAGWNSGFGKCVIIEHGNGLRTLYGHLNTVLVKQGEKVKQFQYIGRVGSTGRTTGPHLHFTIWKDGKIQDPLKYLW
jgi:murein DD-endopeptidase MepM/ murein hydrolase activator NlpD